MPEWTLIATLSPIAFAARLSLGIVFLLSALPKLRRPQNFVQSVIAYEILPASAARAFVFVLIPLEVFLAVALLTGWRADAALPLTVTILLTFLAAVAINLRRKKRVPCGCFGESDEQISPLTAARLLLLLSAAVFLAAYRNVAGGVWPALGEKDSIALGTGSLLEAVTLAGFLLLAGTWLLHLPQSAAIAPPIGREPVDSRTDPSERCLICRSPSIYPTLPCGSS